LLAEFFFWLSNEIEQPSQRRKERRHVMGLLDGIIGNVVGSMLSGNQSQSPLGNVLGGLTGNNSQGGNSLLQIAFALLQQNGGLDGVLNKFHQGGMAEQADSWVSTGQNMGISADQLQQIFGSSSIGNIASKLGMSEDQAGTAMSQVLPELINHLTPQGQVPEDSNDMIAEGLNALTKSLGR
jgi:uncharacterized protein YidB (DUF937 family)